jgi:hypothetical protein
LRRQANDAEMAAWRRRTVQTLCKEDRYLAQIDSKTRGQTVVQGEVRGEQEQLLIAGYDEVVVLAGSGHGYRDAVVLFPRSRLFPLLCLPCRPHGTATELRTA